MLHDLYEYSRTIQTDPLYFESQPIAWRIDLRPDGRPAATSSPPAEHGGEKAAGENEPKLLTRDGMVEGPAPGMPRAALEPLDDGSRSKRKSLRLVGPARQGTSNNDRPSLLVNRPEYAFGVSLNPDGDYGVATGRAAGRHGHFAELIASAARYTGLADLGAVSRFVEGFDRGEYAVGLPDGSGHGGRELLGDELLTFSVDGRMTAFEQGPLVEFWEKVNQGLMANDGTELTDDRDYGVCLLSGEFGPLETVMRQKVSKELPGSADNGAALVSANMTASHNRGCDQLLRSPMSPRAAWGCMQALNRLLESPAHRVKLPPTAAVVIWPATKGANEPAQRLAQSLIQAPLEGLSEAAVRGLEAPQTGREDRLGGLGGTNFSALAIHSRAGGRRAAVVGYYRRSLKELADNVAAHFHAIGLVRPDGRTAAEKGAREPTIDELAAALIPARDGGHDRRALLGRQLALAASLGESPPAWILKRSLARLRSPAPERANSGEISHESYLLHALIKAQLYRQGRAQSATGRREEMDVEDHHHTEQAQGDRRAAALHNCGRLLAQVQDAQDSRPGGRAATSVSDRYYGALLSNPALLGRITEEGKRQLSALRRESPAAANAVEARIAEIMSAVEEIPVSPNQEEQGEIALGYYHQMADNRRRRRQNSGQPDADGATAEAGPADGEQAEDVDEEE